MRLPLKMRVLIVFFGGLKPNIMSVNQKPEITLIIRVKLEKYLNWVQI